jgi:cbb3-type cytochrome oxidase subunit 3
MSLTDIMSAAGLSSWTELALVLCFLSFSAVLAYIFLFRTRRSWEAQRMLPLDDDASSPTPIEEVKPS